MARRLFINRQNVPHHHRVTCGLATGEPDPNLSSRFLKSLTLDCFLVVNPSLVFILALSCTCTGFFTFLVFLRLASWLPLFPYLAYIVHFL